MTLNVFLWDEVVFSLLHAIAQPYKKVYIFYRFGYQKHRFGYLMDRRGDILDRFFYRKGIGGYKNDG